MTRVYMPDGSVYAPPSPFLCGWQIIHILKVQSTGSSMSFLVDVLACVGILVSIQLVRMVISGLQLKAHSYIFIAQV